MSVIPMCILHISNIHNLATECLFTILYKVYFEALVEEIL